VAPAPHVRALALKPQTARAQTRVLNKCGAVEERSCLGPGVMGCDGKCVAQGSSMVAKVADCAGVRRTCALVSEP
jgi:hypothetical protein